MNGLPRIVMQLGVLSLLNDIASEMVFPLLPMFLAALPGGGPVVIGIVEGVAETTGTFLKLAGGLWSDRISRRTPFVSFGYALAGVSRPLIAFAAAWPTVLVLRFLDRVGKGIRSAPRDAMIADSVPPERRGAAFGFQRMMDHGGAVMGPLIAVALIGLGLSIRQVILWAGVPSLVLVALIFSLREPPREPSSSGRGSPFPGSAPSIVGKNFVLLTAAAFVFTLGNSTDAFLILALSKAGVPTASIALLWSLHHVMKISGAWAGGRFTDRAGSKPVMLAGLGLYSVIYFLFGAFDGIGTLVPVFIVYGVSMGMLEPAESAWVASLSSRDKRSTAYGVYHSSKGFAALPASIGFGLIWHSFGRFAAFSTGAGLALAAALILLAVKDRRSSFEMS